MPDTREKVERFFYEAFCFSSSGKSFSGCTSSIRMIQCYSIRETHSLSQMATWERMSMQDWLNETDRFLTNNRRKVLDGKSHISREAAVKKVGAVYDEFRKKQDAAYISEFDREMAKYLKGGEPN